jgi:hypothetical protein
MKKNRKTRPQQRSFDLTSTLLCYATQSGCTTLDTGEGGGNPFASALIEAVSERTIKLGKLTEHLGKLTAAKSHRHQAIECSGEIRLPDWSFQEDLRLRREKRDALVLVVSDYSRFTPDASLIGAAHDERRIAAMLAQHGFSVKQGIGAQRQELIKALSSFKRLSRSSNIAIVYSTGHGVELEGIVYLLPGDYPVNEGFGKTQLQRHAISVAQMTNAASACAQNLVFFAGCRTHV